MMRSKTTTFKTLVVALGILLLSVLPYLHDFEFFKGKNGFSGFSSLRVGMWAVSLFVVALAGWIGFFLKSKGSEYRFAILAPIFMLSFQLGIYLFDARKTTSNDLSTKVWLNLGFAVILIVAYVYGKSKTRSE